MQGNEPYLSGDQLNPYKVARTGKCWWCGAVADSREHKFKRSDLDRLQGGGENLIWLNGQEMRSVRSNRKSSHVKFIANLCAACNNARSQPFDFAYSRFSDYVWDRRESLGRRRFLDMQDVYGSAWPVETANLARYIVKHVGCRMDDNGFSVPAEFAAFLDGGTFLPTMHMVLFRDVADWSEFRKARKKGIDSTRPGFDPAWGAVSRSEQKLTAYGSTYRLGFIGVRYYWDSAATGVEPFYRYRRTRLYRRDRLPVL